MGLQAIFFFVCVHFMNTKMEIRPTKRSTQQMLTAGCSFLATLDDIAIELTPIVVL